jgi:hypothetical protein
MNGTERFFSFFNRVGIKRADKEIINLFSSNALSAISFEIAP